MKTLTLHNILRSSLYATLYKKMANGKFERLVPPILLEPQDESELMLPERNLPSSSIVVVFAVSAHELPKKTSSLAELTRAPITTFSPSRFYVYRHNRKLTVATSLSASWHVQRKAAINSVARQCPMSRDVAKVTKTQMQDPGEKAWTHTRGTRAHKFLRQELKINFPAQKTPTIALCTSGGGFRAFYATLGVLLGLDETGLLDAITYLSTVSGSSWLTLSWLASGMPIQEFKKHAILMTEGGLWSRTGEATRIFSRVSLKKLLFSRHVSFIDWYGALLAAKLLAPVSDDAAYLTLSSFAHANQDLYPFPLASGAVTMPGGDYASLELSPFQVRTVHSDAAIPTWAFGRKFACGVSVENGPEEPLPSLYGTLGSIFSVSVRDMIDHAPGLAHYLADLPLYQKTKALAMRSTFANRKIVRSRLPNFTYHLKGQPLDEQKSLVLADGSYFNNVPLSALCNGARMADVIIILDSKTQPFGLHSSLRQAVLKLAQSHPSLPDIDYKKAAQEPISVFSGARSAGCPTFVYIPLRKNNDYDASFDPLSEPFCSTYNCNYSPKEATLLSGLPQFIVKRYKDVILSAIISHIDLS